MTISFILNGEDVSIEVDAGLRLVDILRDHFYLTGTRISCNTGNCGSCSVIFNGEMMKSCLIPAFKVKNSEVITIEGISQTDEYRDYSPEIIEKELINCGICNSGKVLAAETLLSKNQRPSKKEILGAFQGIRCRCTSPEKLVNGIMALIEERRRRLHVH